MATTRFHWRRPLTSDEVVRVQEIVEIQVNQPGFLGWYGFEVSPTLSMTVNIWRDEASADAGHLMMRDIVQRSFGWILVEPPERAAGEVIHHRTKWLAVFSRADAGSTPRLERRYGS